MRSTRDRTVAETASRSGWSLAVLEMLPLEGRSRTANVKVWGQVLERTVLFYAQWVARHERSHYKQLERIVNVVSG